MEVVIVTVLMVLMVQTCHSANQQRFMKTLYLAENRAVLNKVIQWKTVSSPVICGRDCSMNPNCGSFNYYIRKRICVLNNASRAHSADDFVELPGSLYYDDNVNNPSFSAPIIESYSSCLKMYQAGYRDNGIYTIYHTSLTHGLQVYCDMETDGGGWTVFQRRQDGSVDFYRNWADYQSGFGDLQKEFWLGNAIMRDLTGSGHWQLREDMEDWQSRIAWASYGEFNVTGDKYTLQVGSYDNRSTAGDSLTDHNGRSFTTKDQDNDEHSNNCAKKGNGAWWFTGCLTSHLNGQYYQDGDLLKFQGIQWKSWKGTEYSLKKCSMKLRQVYCDMETDGGGWIVFQRRHDGSVDFYRNWTEYQSGFGDLHNEFWLGNNILRDLTGSGQWELRVEMEDWESITSWASYGEFAVTGDNYTLHVGSYDAQSTAGDLMA
ncbi:uncharacterized protein [Asterias amurensis]|uniref:uncharacterized protein n=1 Tax=Asterias amurensis TaxID=7602 RepID=UPI003AB2EBC2